MNSNNNQGLLEITDVVDYKQRLVNAHDRMKRLGFGAQRACADNINQEPAVISRVIRGIVVDEFVLHRIEQWLQAVDEAQPTQASS